MTGEEHGNANVSAPVSGRPCMPKTAALVPGVLPTRAFRPSWPTRRRLREPVVGAHVMFSRWSAAGHAQADRPDAARHSSHLLWMRAGLAESSVLSC